MLTLAVLVTALATADPPADPWAGFGPAYLPEGCAVKRTGGGLRFDVPAGRRSSPENLLPLDRLVPWTGRTVEGNVRVAVRVRLRFDPEAGAAGVATYFHHPDGRVEPQAVPTVAAGVCLDGPDTGPQKTQTVGYVRYTRQGDRRELHPGFTASWPGAGAGGRSRVPLDGEPLAFWLELRKVGETVEVRYRREDAAGGWGSFGPTDAKLPAVVGLRLFATGNFDKPFSVEFDQLTVTPLPAGEKK